MELAGHSGCDNGNNGNDAIKLFQSESTAHFTGFTATKKYKGISKDETTGFIARRLRQLPSKCSCLHDVHFHAFWHPWNSAIQGHDVPSVSLYRIPTGR